MFTAQRFLLILTLVIAVNPVAAYQTEGSVNLLARDKSSVAARYRFEWEIHDSTRYKNSRADKAQLQERAGDTLNRVLREYATSASRSDLVSLTKGEDGKQALVLAIETNTLIAEWGIRLIDLEFLSTGLD